MKAIKLALIFLGFVAIMVLAISWKQVFKSTNPEPKAFQTNATSKNDATLVHIPIGNENFASNEDVNYIPTSSDNADPENNSISSSTNYEKSIPTTPQDAKAQHIAEKKAIENRAIQLFNSGKYKECEKLCKTEWSLNAYYVDVKTIGRILASTDKAVQVPLNHDGIIDSNGKLTDEYRIKSVADFATLKSVIQRYQ